MTHAHAEVEKSIKNVVIPSILEAGIAAGIKKNGNKDFALIYFHTGAIVFAAFTQNLVKAAPVRVGAELVAQGNPFRAILMNAGNANACTGEEGIANIHRLTKAVATLLKCHEDEILMMSTGVIGDQLPIEKMEAAIPELYKQLGPDNIKDVAEAIMTTDTYPKVVMETVEIRGFDTNIIGICKGSGMIAPNMATMLGLVVTDANCEEAVLEPIFREAVKRSFNRITVDGDMSTNDTIMLAHTRNYSLPLIEGLYTDFYDWLKSKMIKVFEEMARLIVWDGEGISKVVKINVINAQSEEDARTIAFKIGNSPLVKTAIYGEDPNWGRILAAAGASGALIDESKANLWFENVCIAKNGVRNKAVTEDMVKTICMKGEYEITLDLNLGVENFYIYTTDFTYDYIRINADYRS